MKRYTRKHYNKKLVALGLAAFMGIGLTSTGFAAWVMSQNAKEPVNGNVSVSTMTDASVDILIYNSNDEGVFWSKTGGIDGTHSKDINDVSKANEGYVKILEDDVADGVYTVADDLNFDAAIGDTAGRLRNSEALYEGEDLEIRVFGKLDVDDVAYDLTATVDLPDSIDKAIEEGYLKFEASQTIVEDKVYYKYDGTQTEYLDIKFSTQAGYESDFVVTVKLEWGDKFGGMNPSLYYDYDYTGTSGYDKSNPKGKDISDAAMKAEMLAFWNCITGNNYTEDTFDWSASENPKFNGTFSIILEASPKEV